MKSSLDAVEGAGTATERLQLERTRRHRWWKPLKGLAKGDRYPGGRRRRRSRPGCGRKGRRDLRPTRCPRRAQARAPRHAISSRRCSCLRCCIRVDQATVERHGETEPQGQRVAGCSGANKRDCPCAYKALARAATDVAKLSSSI